MLMVMIKHGMANEHDIDTENVITFSDALTLLEPGLLNSRVAHALFELASLMLVRL